MTQRNAGTRGRENESVQFTLRVPYSTWSGLATAWCLITIGRGEIAT